MGKICGQENCPCYDNGSHMLSPIKTGASPRVLILTDSPEMKDKSRIFSGDHTAFILDRIQKSGISGKIGNSFVCGTTIRCYADMSALSESQKATAFKCCKAYFDEMMNTWKPELVISFGKMSLFATLRHKGVKDKQGVLEFSKEYNCWVMPLYASGYILRNMTMEGTWVSGFNTVKNFIDAGWQPPSDTGKFEISEVQSIKGLFTGKEAAAGIAIDTETQGLDWTHPFFTLISYAISPDGKKGYQIYLFEECSEEEKDYTILWERKQKSKKIPTYVHVKRSENFEQKIRELRWFLENPNIKKIMHNGAFDCHVFRAFFKVAGRLLNLPQDLRTVTIRGYDFDTQNAAQLYNEEMYAMCKLETLQKDFTNVSERYDSGTFQGQADKSDMLSVSKELLTVYAAKDVLTTHQASVFFKKHMRNNPRIQNYFDNMVMPTVNTLIEMEHTGAYVDAPRLSQAKIDIVNLRDATHKMAIELVPPKIIEAHMKKGLKLSRNDLVRDTLFSPLGFNLKVINRTKTGEPSADQDTIKLLQDTTSNKKALEFMHQYTEYKKYDTLAGRYLSGFEKHTAFDGRIHSRFSICQAATGRSCLIGDSPVFVTDERKTVPIKNLKKGDSVLCYNEHGELTIGVVNWQKLTQKNAALVEVVVIINGKQYSILCTPDHPFRMTQGTYVEACFLLKGSELSGAYFSGNSIHSCTPIVHEVIKLHRKEDVYDIEVTDSHNFIVNGVCVHNSSQNPNVQNIPNRGDAAPIVRRIISVPVEKKILKADASQAELRWLAHYSRDPVMLKIFREGKVDIHTATAMGIVNFNNPKAWDILDDKQRKQKRKEAKPVNFGFCLAKGTEIKVQGGTKAIEDIQIGDKVLTHRGRYKKVTALQRPRSSVMIQIETPYTSIKGTPDHSMLQRRGYQTQWTSMSNLNFGASLIDQNDSYQEIIDIKHIHGSYETVYDFTVEDDHSFIANGLVSHNCYGMSADSFVTYAKVEYGVDLTLEEAVAYRDAYFKNYANLTVYYDRMVAFGKKYGYVESALGRRRHLPNLNSQKKGEFNLSMRQAINFPIQSASSDTVLLAANEIMKMGLPKKDFKLILFIHDELVAEVREDCDIDKYARILKENIENPPLKKLFGVDLLVPLESEVEFGDNLNDCAKWEFSKK